MLFIISIISMALPSLQAATDGFELLREVKKNCRQTITRQELGYENASRLERPRLESFLVPSPILEGDQPEDFVENPSKMIKSLKTMDEQKLLEKSLSRKPWSDSYWPLYLGSIAQRYNDRNFIDLDYQKARAYMKDKPTSALVKKKQFDHLSPSEKYDVVFGLKQGTLTEASWSDGDQYFKNYGKVETWMGLCHGWAAASIMMPNPAKKVPVKVAAGTLNFFPSDIKALGTLLWAKGNANSRFLGGRCNSKNPPVDSNNRPKEQECLDTNPGTWHLTIVNQIGLFDRSFVMDATYDYQVWNQPVYGYKYQYYNPKTGKTADTLEDALVKRSEWPEDPRKEVRAEKTDSIVGIKMKVIYVVENYPSTDENQPSELEDVSYKYDLELNSKYEIIGGEWYTKNHPDFLWVPDQDSFPVTEGENPGTRVSLNRISPSVKEAAAVNAEYGVPFGPIVKEFFKASSK